MKGIKECGNCFWWLCDEDDWGTCDNVMVDELIAVATDTEDEVGLVFHREVSCRGYDYINEYNKSEEAESY